MSYLFTSDIYDWSSWGKVFQSIDVWRPLIEYIFKKEKLTFTRIENLTPGTNAVFKVGEYVIKFFAPTESGIDNTLDIQTETFAIKHTNTLGISVPKCVACGNIKDKYSFSYIIMEFIAGREFTDISASLSYDQKIAFGRKLREVTDKMNIPCESFNDIDVINDKGRYRRWDKYPEFFRKERLDYIKKYDYGEKVFVHGDLCSDNILVTDDRNRFSEDKLFIIDFADAVSAPVIYEHALVASELFRFDRGFLTGYFGGFDIEMLTDLCFNGLLIHDFGGDIIARHVADPNEITSLKTMRECLYGKIRENLPDEAADINAIRNHYDSLIDENNDPVHDPQPLREYMDKWDGKAFMDELRLSKDKDVLEIGVGTGRLAVKTAPSCREFYGIDFSPKTIERAKQNLGEYEHVNLICADFLTFPFEKTFDVVYSSLTFLHIKNKSRAIKKAAELLNSGGRFVLSISKSRDRLLEYGDRKITLYPDSPEEITDLLTKAGLAVENRFETDFAEIFTATKGSKS